MQKPTATFKRQAEGANMGKRAVLFLAVAVMAVVILPATAFGAGLKNEYGMHYAGQPTCTGCHGAEYANQVHGRFATRGLLPKTPVEWTKFKGPGNPLQVPVSYTHLRAHETDSY